MTASAHLFFVVSVFDEEKNRSEECLLSKAAEEEMDVFRFSGSSKLWCQMTHSTVQLVTTSSTV